ncbi:serine/arginine repetitive matrix protein 2 isoform X2 [Solea solea]|uniref:serine/arginine repetitive matrix protein 2 isoform X2 n=1 Tax=Solea solea TaxID=90069 RepID=UPI00272C3848|nr:serine/arginine repetitive matrix protein 2 isoform X2 [Solea solea]
MEKKNVILKRPRRKLWYTINKESRPKLWADEMTLGDVDRMFDDMDSSSHCDSQVSSSPQQKSSDTDTQHSGGEASLFPQDFVKSTQCQKGPEGNALLPAKRLISPKLGTDFQMPGPVKTSSPIENMVVEHVEEEIIGRTLASPILLDCEDEGKKEATTESLTAQKSPLSGDSVLNSPPHKFALRKPTVSCHKNKVDGPLTEKTQEKPQTSKGKGKTSTKENCGKPTPAVIKESEHVSLEKPSTGLCGQLQVDASTRAGKDIPAFLQKLRDAGQPKPARKLPTPVKTPPLPAEPEDNFLILEDDVPLLFTIPKKNTSRRQKHGSSSSTDKDVSTEMGTNNSPRKSVHKEEGPVIQKKKSKKERTKKNEGTGPGNEKDEFTSPEYVPAGDLVEQEQEKPNKKKKLKKIPSKESDKAEEEATDTARQETADENPEQRAEKKVQKTSEPKRLKSSKENAKTSRSESLKGSRKVKQGSGGIKESENDEVVKEPSQTRHNPKHADVDLDSLADHHIINTDTEAKDSAGGKVKQKKQQIMSEGSFSEEGQILCKRKRKPVGQWWLSCPQSTEETEVKDDQPTLKKSKQHNKEPSSPGPSPAKAKKDNTKKRTLKQPTLLSSQETIKAKQKSPKNIKNRPVREGTQNEKTSTDDVLNTSEAEQTEEQQQVLDKDPDPVQSSPSVFKKTDSGYQGQPSSPETQSHRPAPVTPIRASTAGSEKRRRKSPGNWWMVDGSSEDVESTSSQPQQLQNKKKPKSHKERKKQAKPSRSPGLGIPQNGNMAVLPKPADRSHVSPLKPKSLSAPKTVKRSLAMFKDIFTSRSDTPAVGAGGSVTAGPANEATVTHNGTFTHTEKDLVSMDDGDIRSMQHNPNSHDAPQSSGLQPENTLRDLRSGPSSMVMLEQSDNTFALPPSVPPELRLSDLCAPPLKPLILQPMDKTNLTEWFKSLWSSSVDNGDITADHFEWYFYQGRAMGILADLNCDSICNGKILLGSHMKKPLWVDHSATTVFNLLTSSVSVIVDGRKTAVNAGDSFMVQCGQAYSLQNTSAQPAVLYFTRILAESSD